MTQNIISTLFIWFIASIFYAYQYVLRVLPNSMMDDIMVQYSMDSALFGQYSGIYYIGYALMQIPIGIMLDKHGPKKVMSISLVLIAIGMFPIIFTNIWFYPIIGRLFIGIGSASAILGAFQITRMLFKPHNISKMYGITMFVGISGAIFGGEPINILCTEYGYKSVTLALSIFGFVLSAIIYFTFPNITESKAPTTYSEIKEIFTNKRLMILSIISGFLVGPTECFSYIWGQEFLQNVYGFNIASSNVTMSLVFVGCCIGSIILPIIADKNDRYIETLIVLALVMMALFIMIISFRINGIYLMVTIFTIGIGSAYEVLSLYKVTNYVHKNSASLATATCNMLIMLFGYGFHFVTGLVVNIYMPDGAAVAYSYGIMIIPITLGIGLAGLIYLWSERHHEANFACREV